MHSHDRTLLASLGFADPDKKDPRHDLACQYLALPENHERLARMVIPEKDVKRGGQYTGTAEVMKDRGQWSAPLAERWDFRFTRTVRMKLSVAHWSAAYARGPVLEHMVSKGEGKYKTTVGFIDVLLPFAQEWIDVGTISRWEAGENSDFLVDPQRFDATTQKAISELTQTTSAPAPWQCVRCVVPACVLHVDLRRGRGGEVEIAVFRRGDEVFASLPEMNLVERPHTRADEAPGFVPVEVKIARANIGDVLRQIALYREHAFAAETWILATPYALDKTDLATLRNARITHIRLGEKFEQWVAARSADVPDEGDESPEI